ncbi:MAG: metallopeptidase TldD-related protein, partial [Myxococcota bacterium]|nr:metallopeptidase TldD-related protein [Myxococcota bacterium]
KTLPIQSHALSKRQRSQWEEELKKQSKIFLEYTNVFASFVSLDVEREDYFVVTTDDTRLQHQRIHYRLSVYAKTKAVDGMELRAYDYVDTHSLDGLPKPKEIEKMVRDSAQKVLALREAPLVDPFVGPAILRGRAAAVFFHEILGHRIEGHRQKDEDEGQTLSDKVGEQILPPFLSIEDNPILRKWNGIDLNGFYQYDSEGSVAEQVPIVSNGVLKNFLMSRSPIENFSTSNGHGRREIGYPVVARQGNLIVSAAKTSSYDALRNQLIELIKEQEKPFGLIFDDISGGFTFTGRNSPNSYSVQPVTVWKVFPDGRPDELVRGVDLIGTPLITFGRIKAASDQTSVFNGNCGAESGWVPVSAIAPDLLVTEVEVQRKDKDTDRLPILPAPKGVKQ